MKCGEFEELVVEFAEGHLANSEHAEVSLHLGACAKCRAVYEEQKKLVSRLRGVRNPQAPDHLWTRVNASVQDHVTIRVRKFNSVIRLASAATFAALFLLIGLGVVLFNNKEAPPKVKVEVVSMNVDELAGPLSEDDY